MRRPGLIELGSKINEILDQAILLERTYKGGPDFGRKVIGSILHNPESQDLMMTKIAASRLGLTAVEYNLHKGSAMSESEILSEVAGISSVVDNMITSIVDKMTFGNGRELTQSISDISDKPVISIRDDVYAHQPALADLLALKIKLGELKGKNIVISWGFGNRFSLPSTAHSLVVLSANLGANVRIVSPSEFSLLRRVKRDAELSADSEGGSIEEVNEFENAFTDVDAVIAHNWCRMDDYQHPERNTERALEFRDWFFTPDVVQKETLFLAEPPLQTDLLASTRLLASERNLTYSSYTRRVSTLAASILFGYYNHEQGKRYALV